MTYVLGSFAGALIALIPTTKVFAATMNQPFYMGVCWGGIPCVNMLALTQNMNNAFLYSAFFIGLAIFIVGAFLMVISAGNDTLLQSAKRAMKGSLIGVALVAGSYGLYRTVVFLFYM